MNKEKYYDGMALWISGRVVLITPHFTSQGVLDRRSDMVLWNYIKKSNVMDTSKDHVEVYNRVEEILYKKYSAGME